MIETITRTEWFDRNPAIKSYVASTELHQTGWYTAPAFSLWPDPQDVPELSNHQRDRLAEALTAKVSILGGSPGTGKTYTVAKLIKHMIRVGIVSVEEIGIGAPTGKAAVRLTEMLNASGIPTRARTWHSLLGIKSSSETGGFGFAHDDTNKLPYRLLIGDECSMLDLSMMLSIFKAAEKGCHILLVGDTNQLPPVGNGAPMRDMIAAGLPFAELREIKRNSGGIVEACAAIRDSDPWIQFTRMAGTNLHLHNLQTPAKKIERMIDLIRKTEQQGADPIWDCQVLVAVNESSPLSRKKINEVLQDELNPGQRSTRTIFRVGDKAVCLKNGIYKSHLAQTETYVANGELAQVLAIDETTVVMQLDSPAREVAVSIRKSDEGASPIANWDLAYALSVHKSQGSEFPNVIVMLDEYPGARMICDRAWIYTAISRARDTCHLVGQPELAERFCLVSKLLERKTFLSELIRREGRSAE